jgi:hypothetical protein
MNNYLLVVLEKTLRERSKIISGKRILNEADSIELQDCEAQINRCHRQQKAIEKDTKTILSGYGSV